MADHSKLIESKLIELVKGHRLLYDTSHPDYGNQKRKSKIWSEIGQKLYLKREDARDMWTRLRSRYRQAINRQVKNMESGVAAKKKPWKFLVKMSFLETFRHSESGSRIENTTTKTMHNYSSHRPEPPLKENYRTYNNGSLQDTDMRRYVYFDNHNIANFEDNTSPGTTSDSIGKRKDEKEEVTNKELKTNDKIFNLTKFSPLNEDSESHSEDDDIVFENEGHSQMYREENDTENDDGRRDAADQPIVADSTDNQTNPQAPATPDGKRKRTDLVRFLGTYENVRETYVKGNVQRKKPKKRENLSSLIKLSLNQQEESTRERAFNRTLLLKQRSDSDDPLYHFFMSMYQLTKQMPLNHQHVVRCKLFQAVSDAEMDMIYTTDDRPQSAFQAVSDAEVDMTDTNLEETTTRPPSAMSSDDSVSCTADLMYPPSVETQINVPCSQPTPVRLIKEETVNLF